MINGYFIFLLSLEEIFYMPNSTNEEGEENEYFYLNKAFHDIMILYTSENNNINPGN